MENNVKTAKQAKFLTIFNIILVIIIVILALILVSMSFLWTPMTISGPSMEPTFQDGDKIILLTSFYKYTYGDIIVFEKIAEEKNVIKRVIGLPGDYMKYNESEKAWYRNGEKLVEDYVVCEYTDTYLSISEIKSALTSQDGYLVEEDHLFVLGDNRINSDDSHRYGAISSSQIKGKYLFRY